MNKTEIETRILKCFAECGIPVWKEEGEDDIFLSLFIPDSLAFINIVVKIEEEFNVEFPDDLLTMNSFNSLAGLTNIVVEILEEPGA